MNWQPIQKPAEIAESRLLEAILSGSFPINSNLLGERDLAKQLGVTRPTLREVLQRLARDGWLEIQQGKPTRVRDYWKEGSMAVLAALARSPSHQSPDFVTHLLELRVLLAPAYTQQALKVAASEIADLLEGHTSLGDTPSAFALADWDLHRLLTQHADNPVFRLLLNSFRELYILMGEQYFSFPECRASSRAFYTELLNCARNGSDCDAESLTRCVMKESLSLWQKMQKENP
jgi:GntR family transcriptional regulator, negative regulator for fad regulon and positive regulator of fabA